MGFKPPDEDLDLDVFDSSSTMASKPIVPFDLNQMARAATSALMEVITNAALREQPQSHSVQRYVTLQAHYTAALTVMANMPQFAKVVHEHLAATDVI